MADKKIFDLTAAHVYRDGKIIFTILIEQGEDGWYTAYPEGKPDIHLAQRKSRAEVLDHMDLYRDGFAAGFDTGVEHATQNYWNIGIKPGERRRCCAGDVSCACEH